MLNLDFTYNLLLTKLNNAIYTFMQQTGASLLKYCSRIACFTIMYKELSAQHRRRNSEIYIPKTFAFVTPSKSAQGTKKWIVQIGIKRSTRGSFSNKAFRLTFFLLPEWRSESMKLHLNNFGSACLEFYRNEEIALFSNLISEINLSSSRFKENLNDSNLAHGKFKIFIACYSALTFLYTTKLLGAIIFLD